MSASGRYEKVGSETPGRDDGDDGGEDVTDITASASATPATGDAEPQEKSGRFFNPNLRLLFYSVFLSAFDVRMWEFGVALFIMDIGKDTLRLAAIYGAVTEGSGVLFNARIGAWVDRNSRLFVVRSALVVQNLCVAAGAAGVFFILYYYVDAVDGCEQMTQAKTASSAITANMSKSEALKKLSAAADAASSAEPWAGGLTVLIVLVN
ncbi:MAG: hypothetical protein GWP75_09340, partial [Planctomycetia bacterium]|nr:hypothetical protein [Planctomycetia bacterium]